MKSRIEWSETKNSNEWDDFVVRNGGSIFHSWSWRKALETNYSRPLYLACRDAEGEVIAVCPFFYRAGKRLEYLESLPHSHMAGPVLSNQATNVSQIIESLRKSVKFSPLNPVVAMRIKVHHQRIAQPMVALGYRYDVTFGLFILDLQEKTPDHIWNNGFQKHDRQAVKYYERLGSAFGFAKSENEYSDYLTLQKGSTTRQIDRADFLSKMRLNLGDRLKVAIVTLEGKVIAGFPMLCDPENSTIHLVTWVTVAPYKGMVRNTQVKNAHSPVTYVNWKTINWAHEHGFRYVDFGVDYSPEHWNRASPFSMLSDRFETKFVPRYRFTLPTGFPYSVARRINRELEWPRYRRTGPTGQQK